MSPTVPSSADAYKAINDFNASQPKANDVLSQADAKYGIPELQGRVSDLQGLTNNLTNSIAAVDPSVTGRTSGSLVTEAQRSALVNRERQPLLDSFNKTSADLGGERNNLTLAHQLAGSYADSMMREGATKYSNLWNNYQNALTGEQTAKDNAYRQAQAEEQRQRAIEAANLEQQKFDEQVREWNNPHTTASSGLTPESLAALLGGGAYGTTSTDTRPPLADIFGTTTPLPISAVNNGLKSGGLSKALPKTAVSSNIKLTTAKPLQMSSVSNALKSGGLSIGKGR
jgi:hypothetical protein